jgi:hypothetical protein
MKQRVPRLAFGVAVLLAAPASGSGGAPEGDPPLKIELPRRVSAEPPSPPAPPELPARAGELMPASFEWVVAWEGRNGASGRSAQTVVRTSERILLVAGGGASEWLFERNPVDPRRVSGYLVDHAKHQVLLHHDSDLRARLRLRGWADVLSLGFDASALQGLRATGERRVYEGVAFEQFVAPQPTAQGVVEVWWSESLLMPLLLTVREGGRLQTSMLEGLETRVEPSRLADPRLCFPSYAAMDVSDQHDRRH